MNRKTISLVGIAAAGVAAILLTAGQGKAQTETPEPIETPRHIDPSPTMQPTPTVLDEYWPVQFHLYVPQFVQ